MVRIEEDKRDNRDGTTTKFRGGRSMTSSLAPPLALERASATALKMTF